MKRQLSVLAVIAVMFTFSNGSVWAQGEAPSTPPAEAPVATPAETPAPTPAATPAPAETPAPAPATPLADGPRYRWGVALSGGMETVAGFSGPMAGMDARFGLQFNDLIGAYLQTHLSFGKLDTGVDSIISGWTGTFSAAAMGEATLLDRFFAGAGIGYGVLNNPSGFMLHARVGAYPLMSRIENSVRRRGLMLGVDVKTIFIDGATGVLVMASVGYEKY